jgi:adenylate kinase family enzyme
MQRVAIIGCGGSGKSTLAQQLGAIVNIDVVHLDRLFWQPGWVEPSKDAWQQVVQSVVAGERWIIDGNYGGTMDMRLNAADTIIFLDMPRSLCLWRIIKRRAQYHGTTRPDVAVDCPEKLDWTFIKYVWKYPAARRPQVLQKLMQYRNGKRVIILRSRADAQRFLNVTTHEHAARTTSLGTMEQN